MTLPNFLGVAAPRSGSTWLHELLAKHPDIYMPTRRKEIHYFDRNYQRGIDWYAKFFPDDTDAAQYRAIGEFTPNYLYSRAVLERIQRGLPVAPRLIVIARNPIERAYSYYLHRVRIGLTRDSFPTFIARDDEVVEYGLYFKHLHRCLGYFDRRQILILIYEEAVADVEATQTALADFLGVDRNRFAVEAGMERVYGRRVPSAMRLFALAHKGAKYLRQRDLDWIVNSARRLGIERVFGESVLPQMDEDSRRYLASVFEPDIQQLERFLDHDLSAWRRPVGARAGDG